MAAAGAADGMTVRAMPLEEALRGAVEGVPGIEGAWVSGDSTSPSAPAYVVVVGSLGVEELDGTSSIRCRVALVPIVGPVGSSLPISDPPTGRGGWPVAIPSPLRCGGARSQRAKRLASGEPAGCGDVA